MPRKRFAKKALEWLSASKGEFEAKFKEPKPSQFVTGKVNS